MAIVRITKEFRFEGAHALTGYDGKCKHIHGHSYILYITVKGKQLEDISDPKNGMLIDFKVLKDIVNKTIINKFDHALVMREGTCLIEEISKNYGNVLITQFQPTCENMVGYFAEELSRELPDNVLLSSIKLYETATSYVEWLAVDNK